MLGRGYVIVSEPDFKRLEKQIKTFMMVSLVLIIGLGTFGSNLQSIVVVAVLMGFYAVWAWYLTRRMQRSDEGLSLKESPASQARAHSALSLWLVEIASLAMAGGSIWMFFAAPGERLVAFAGIVLSGACATKFTIQIVQRNRQPAA